MSIAEAAEALKSVVTSLAAVAGVYIAWSGLSNWKRQKLFERDSDLARRYLVSVYRYESALAKARTGVEQGKLRSRRSYEYLMECRTNPELLKESSAASLQWQHDTEIFVVDTLYVDIDEEFRKLKELSFEAEALWDDYPVELLFFLSRFEVEWRTAAQEHVNNSNPLTIEMRREMDHGVFWTAFLREGLPEDTFDQRLRELVLEAEKYLKSRIVGRNQ